MLYKTLIILFILVSSFHAQQKRGSKAFSSYEFTLLGGASFEKSEKMYGAGYFEGITNIYDNAKLKLGVGYYSHISQNSYRVNSYKFVKIEGVEKYNTITYQVKRVEYQAIPISAGILYSFKGENIIPYLTADIGYSFIDPLPIKTSDSFVNEYDTFEEIPENYREIDVLPNSSFTYSIGAGLNYKLSDLFTLNLRYLYRIDSEIANTHQVLLGLSLLHYYK